MSDPRSLRFVHPGAPLSGIRAEVTSGEGPGLVVSPTGRLEWVTGEDSVRQALMLLLSTRPGERVMRPDYGCPLDALAFEPNDETTAGIAMGQVRRAIERWEPRVRIVRLSARPVGPDRLVILLEYRVRSLPQTETLRWTVPLAGEDDA
jgi:phage baseplate assembly protein W